MHTEDGWFLESCRNSYRAFKCHIKSTKASRIIYTMKFIHKHITQPAFTPENVVTKAAHNLTSALKGRNNALGDKQKHDLEKLS